MPDLGSTYFLPRMIGTARAKGLTMLGDALSAEDAGTLAPHLGLRRIDNALMSQAEALWYSVSRSGRPRLILRIKSMFNQEPRGAAAGAMLAMETVAQSELGDTKDFAEGVQAFRSKRAPKFVRLFSHSSLASALDTKFGYSMTRGTLVGQRAWIRTAMDAPGGGLFTLSRYAF